MSEEKKTDISVMSASELEAYIEEAEQGHRRLMKALRALLRVRQEQEAQK